MAKSCRCGRLVTTAARTYTLYLTQPFERAWKKLPPQVRERIQPELLTLEQQPQRGARLEGKFRFLYALHLKVANTQYRVVYQINQASGEIYLYYVASRENFYAELRRLNLKKGA